PEAVPNCMRQTGTIAVRVSIPVCSQSDSKAWRRQPNAACGQVSDPTLDFPYAIALPLKGGGDNDVDSVDDLSLTPARRAWRWGPAASAVGARNRAHRRGPAA